jgi:hypothetical protein
MRATGQEPSDEFLNQGKLRLDLVHYMDAFDELSTCRAIGQALGQIPWCDAVTYAEMYNYDLDEFLIVIREMDAVFLAECSK